MSMALAREHWQGQCFDDDSAMRQNRFGARPLGHWNHDHCDKKRDQRGSHQRFDAKEPL
jgi:hypothetical protein